MTCLLKCLSVFEVKAIKTLICSLLAAQITMGHLRRDRLHQKLPGKKLFWRKKLRQNVILEWKKEIAIMHMYPIQTVGSSCPTFSTSAAKKHNVLIFLPRFYILYLISAKTLWGRPFRNICTRSVTFNRCSPSVQKLKFHHAPKDIGWCKFAYLKFLFKFSAKICFNSLLSTPLCSFW